MATDDEDQQQLKLALELSLQDVQKDIDEQEREKQDTIAALAASLGKSVDQLTAREVLSVTMGADIQRAPKRPAEDTNSSAAPSKKPNTTGDRFWEGAVKLTYIAGFTDPRAIRIEDIIQKNTLKKAVLTAMVASEEFLETHIPRETNVCLVMHGPRATSRQVGNRVLITAPMLNSKFGVFHSKLMLLVHDTYMRVVIGSANLISFDYRDIENVVFIQDFPKLQKPVDTLPTFAKDLEDVLDKLRVPASVKQELYNYDYSKAKAQIVASVSGTFEGADSKNYGHPKLAKIVKSMLSTSDLPCKPTVEMQTSSLGGLNVGYMNQLYKSFCGIDTIEENRQRKRDQEVPPIKIVFPSYDTVLNSKLGPSGADTIFFNRSLWQKSTFPKQVMHDAVSYREGSLMHSKYIVATLPRSSNSNIRGWVYLGSHNATQAAWGSVSISKDSKRPKLTMNNWELGVVLPIYNEGDIPITFIRPPPPYRPDQEPWIQ
ncbi:hypothetical protein VTP01DRAFT_7046 [Rhizomucor pusillus]|uniref:uncharacterized protein n=1 Tax=Rhizomucor pusillus TaxID=4840 RepID=UPI003744AD9F